jgi:exonuclease SbcD
MKLLHTADWHLGARLVERERLEEQAAFLDWLLEWVKTEQVDALLVSGDVFDAANPPQEAVRLYYDFIRRLTELRGVRAVITGGNHDSALHLNAPRDLLERFGVRVFGNAAATPEAALVDLGDVVVAAVPFLRERDLRLSVAGESAGDALAAVKAGIAAHYAGVRAAGEAVKKGRPLMAMGHLTAAGVTHSDSERDIHIGNLGAVGTEVFAGFDYVALGHLHRPQKVGGQEHIRYSGSPVALSFSEAADAKSMVLLETGGTGLTQRLIEVPTTRKLVRVTVTLEALEKELSASLPNDCWAEVTVKLAQPEAELDRRVREIVGARAEVLKVLAELPAAERPAWQQAGPHLHEMKPAEVFAERLRASGVADEEAELAGVFGELMAEHEKRRIA